MNDEKTPCPLVGCCDCDCDCDCDDDCDDDCVVRTGEGDSEVGEGVLVMYFLKALVRVMIIR